MSEAREIAEHQLEVAIKDVLADELEACWSRLNDDSAVEDPEEQMEELLEWFSDQVKALAEEIMEQEPAEDDDDYEDDEDDEEEDDEDGGGELTETEDGEAEDDDDDW